MGNAKMQTKNMFEPKGDDKTIGKGVNFVRYRRITGYLTTYDRSNNAKKAEMDDRVKHGFKTDMEISEPCHCGMGM